MTERSSCFYGKGNTISLHAYLMVCHQPPGLILKSSSRSIPAYALLAGPTCMGHIDDSLLVGQSFDSFRRNITGTVGLFTNLGFTIHPVNSGFCTGQYHYDSNPH